MPKISSAHCRSFAHSLNEEISCPEEFLAATTQWLKKEQPVIARLSYAMALHISEDEVTAVTAQAVVGYVLRLMAHAGANQDLANLWIEGRATEELAASAHEDG